MSIYQSTTPYINISGKKCWSYSLTGNSIFGNVTRTGWTPVTRLSERRKQQIAAALQENHVDRVYRRGDKYFKFYMNGNEVEF